MSMTAATGLILIIDDSVANIRLLTKLLEGQGSIIFATSGDDGMALAQRQRPDVILLDVEMPDMNGYDVCRQLKANPATATSAIIFITSHGSAEHEVAALEAGAVDFIAKPLNPPVVRARVQTQLTMRQALHAMTIAREQAEQASRTKSEFMATVSHELRTPLTSISGALGLVLGKASNGLSDKARVLLEAASRNAERLTLLINDILDLEKIELGKLDFECRPLDLVALTRQAISANDSYAALHHVRLTLTATPATALVWGNANRLLQVFANLISNAVKYSPVDGAVELAIVACARGWRVIVRDYGRGIPEAFKSRIFQRFAQADSSDTREQGGTGLGLSISKAIIERHHGMIDYQSVEGEGAEFYFYLPAYVAPALAANPGADVGAPTILHIEDDTDIIQITQVLVEDLASYHYAVSLAQARQLLAQRRFDLVILDLTLADGTGLALLPAIDSASRILVFTDQESTPELARQVSMVLTKSKTSNDQFLAAVKSLLPTTAASAVAGLPAQV